MRKWKGSKKEKRHRPKPDDEVEEEMMADAGSKEEESNCKFKLHPAPVEGGNRRKKKLVTVRWTDELMELHLVDELIAYMLCAPLNPILQLILNVGLDPDLDARLSAAFEKNCKFYSNLLQQHRINGYTEIQWEFTDDDEEEQEEA
ncbi:hypothetical protein E2562_034941 [Oryza meyeriana var. granulata]|uniref:Uncharacterized protein n=1 Tax=Oryza meyeriana var. granulata TaxID=110450 RepID=A0A6G1F1J1_9ORYZ|nr:hypothetical protein E2562_034941 [Oryza meyeriana var. granulata]